MPRPLPLFLPLPPALDEWALRDALRAAGFPVNVRRTSCRRSVKVTGKTPFPPEKVRAIAAQWTAENAG